MKLDVYVYAYYDIDLCDGVDDIEFSHFMFEGVIIGFTSVGSQIMAIVKTNDGKIKSTYIDYLRTYKIPKLMLNE